MHRSAGQQWTTIISVCLYLANWPVLTWTQTTGRCVSGYDTMVQEAVFVNLTNEDIYKKWMRPRLHSQTLMNTSIEMYSMASVNERDSEFAINLLIDLMWTDPRLIANDSFCEQITDLSIEGSEWHLNRIWSPKLRIPNNKNPASMDRDAKIILLRLSSMGFVRLRKRLNLELFCQMNFRYYPFDKQQCDVQLISSDLSEDHLAVEWASGEEPFTSNNNTHFSGYSVTGVDLKSGSVVSKGENFSSITIVFHFERQWAHYIIDVYLSSILIVIVSWLSFWMEISATPARVMLGMTTLLTFVTFSKDARDDLPNYSYVNALDVWLGVCTGFIFLSLIEFSIVTYISREEKRHMKQIKTIRRNLSQSQMSLTSAETQFVVNDSALLCPPKSPNLSTRFRFDQLEVKVPTTPTFKDKPFLLPVPPSKKRVKLTLTPPDSPNTDIETNSKTTSPDSVKFKRTLVEIAVEIDRKSRYCFPIVFFVFVISYFTVIVTR